MLKIQPRHDLANVCSAHLDGCQTAKPLRPGSLNGYNAVGPTKVFPVKNIAHMSTPVELPVVVSPPQQTGCCHESPTPADLTTVALPILPSVPAVGEPVTAAGGCCHGTGTAQEADVTCGTTSAAEVPVAEVAPADEVQMIEALKQVIDPELMINIVDLGLIYAVTQDDRQVHVEMTLTSPACPAGPQIVHQSKMALEQLPGIDKANIRLVMSPPWTPARMTDEARDILGIF